MKLKQSSYDILKEELEKNEVSLGPFSKSTNMMQAFDLMEKGDLMSSNQVTKINLINIIKLLCSKLEWTEDLEENKKTNTEVKDDSSENENKTQVNVQDENKKTQQNCKFYMVGKCQFGKNGKKPNKDGKICAFSHLPTCKKFENYSHNKEEGCRNKKCDKMHLKVCKFS